MSGLHLALPRSQLGGAEGATVYEPVVDASTASSSCSCSFSSLSHIWYSLSERASYFCNRNLSAASSSTVRLVDGFAPSEGRVEVYHNGEWGTVCNDMWNLANARVVCKQLGFHDVLNYNAKAYGQGSGKILMDNVQCVGTETALQHCPFNGWEINNCFHTEDVGVICLNGKTKNSTR